MKTYYFILLLAPLLLFSCKKKDKEPGPSAFENLSWADSPCEEGNTGTISLSTVAGLNYRYPVFNPTVSNEFIYYQYDYDTTTNTLLNPQIVKYHIRTAKKTILLEGKRLAGPIAWSSTGQIAFMVSENSIYKIYTMNADGSNLTLQTTLVNPSLPYLKWATDGNSFYWVSTHEISSNNKIQYLLNKDPYSSTIDSTVMPNGIYSMDISKNSQLLNFTGNGYYELSSLSEETPTVSEFQLEPGMFLNAGLGYNPSGKKFYASIRQYHEGGVYEIDIAQNTVSRLLKGCKASFIEYISVSKGYILMEQRGVGEEIHPYEIWILDLENKKEALMLGE